MEIEQTDHVDNPVATCPNQVGTVVIGRNEAERLPATLLALQSLGTPLVYVDSMSIDNSVDVANNLGVETIVLSADKPVNASRARNAGMQWLLERFPDLRYVQFVDGDTVISLEWLPAAVAGLDAQPQAGFVCGQLREKDRDSNIYRRLCDMEWRWEATDNAEPSRLGGMGLMRIEAFKQAGGYDENLIAGADPELYGRLAKHGWQLQVLPHMMGLHDSGMVTFKQWWTRCVKAGHGFAKGYANGAWRKDVRSAMFWAGLLPFLMLSVIGVPNGVYLSLFIAGLYPLNVLRIWLGPTKKEFSSVDRGLYAAALMVMKFGQLLGILRFILHKQIAPIQYK